MTRYLAFLVTAVGSALIWAASSAVTGSIEPWDAEGPYYLAALVLLGILAGVIRLAIDRSDGGAARQGRSLAGYLLGVYFGAFVGQLAYMILFLPSDPLLLVGTLFLAGFSVVVVAAAALVAAFRIVRSAARLL